MGKLSAEELQKVISCVKKDPRVIVPPMSGYDAGVHLLWDKYLIVSTDPCIGVPDEWFGWLLIHYAASDVAIFGAKPEFCTITLLGPPATKPEVFQSIMHQACRATDELGMAIVRGHTGTYDGLSKPVGVCTAYGTVAKEKLVTPGNARAGDLILCTKSVGLETLANFSLTHKALAERLFGLSEAEKLSKLVTTQTCVWEALQLAEIDGVHAMHDATEGGLAMALNEMADASRVGFKVELEKMPISQEARILQEHFKLSDEEMLSMSSTGTVLAAVDAQARDRVQETLRRNGVLASFLGTFTKSKERILVRNKRTLPFLQVARDPYNRILSGKV
jgi:hydrogenase maturation factor